MALTMGRDYWGQHRRLAWWFVHIGDRLTAPLVDYFTPNSTDVWRYFRDVEGVPEDRLIRIYNGIDVSRFVFTEEMRQRGRQLLGLSESDLCIGCVGTLKHQKGQAFLLQAFGSLTNQFPQTRLVFVGRGDSIYVQRLGEEAQRMGLADRCLFIGEVLDVRPVLAGIDVFALPSLVEGFPTVALEAMAMTRPCLVTNISGSREAVVHGETGFVVPPGNPEAIADGLSVLLSSPALRVKMGAAAQRRVLEHFTVQKMVTSYETLYERGLKEKGIYV
jgi:glycosyltransferase involved in cell wall biosynthesis